MNMPSPRPSDETRTVPPAVLVSARMDSAMLPNPLQCLRCGLMKVSSWLARNPIATSIGRSPALNAEDGGVPVSIGVARRAYQARVACAPAMTNIIAAGNAGMR